MSLPAVRELIRPDPGYVLCDLDFDRADAQIVAWSAGDEELKHIFQQGIDVHTENAAWIYNKAQTLSAGKLGVTGEERQRAKNCLHALHYGAHPKTLASTAGGVTVAHMEGFTHHWFSRFPGVPRWHRRVEQSLHLRHAVNNAWGFRRFYFDRYSPSLHQQALAWIGQSTVAVAINKAMLRIYHELPEVQLLLQVHDSLLMQVPEHLAPVIFPTILDTMRVSIPFDGDPLEIPVSLKWSAENYGSLLKWIDATTLPKLVASAA